MKSIKTILSLILVITMLASFGGQAFAEYEEEPALRYSSWSIEEIAKENAIATGGYERICYVGSISSVQGTSVPTSAWSFWDGVYSGTFSGVSAGIYTNYYFTGANTIKVGFDNLRTQSGTAQLIYSLIDLSDSNSTKGPYFSSNLSESSYGEAYHTFSALEASHHYCVFLWSSNTNKIDGSIVVSSTNGGVN